MTQEFAIFALGDGWYAFDVRDVREVLRAAALSAAPGQSDLEGLFNLRGEVVPVIDLRSLLGHAERPIAASDFLIVIGNGKKSAAVRTESNVRLETVDAAAVDRSEDGSLIVGKLRIEERIVSLVSVETLAGGISKIG